MENDEKTPMGSNNAEHVIGWIEKLSNLLKKMGLQNILMTIMVLFLVIVVGQAAFNPTGFINKIEEIQNKQHAESVLKRLENDPAINSNLYNLATDLHADKALIFETHNGGSNLSNLPFLYIDLTYGCPKSEMAIMEPEYKNTRLSRYPWANYMYTNMFWVGNIDDMLNIDPELYYRLSKDGIIYMGAILMYGNDSLPCGMIVVSFKSEENIPPRNVLMNALHKYSNILAGLLVPNK